MVDLSLFPEQLPGDEVKARILAISKPNRSDLYNPTGELLDSEATEHTRITLGWKTFLTR